MGIEGGVLGRCNFCFARVILKGWEGYQTVIILASCLQKN